MSEEPNLDDVIDPGRSGTPDHREHAKTPKHVNDDDLERRTEAERIDVGAEDYDPKTVPDAEG